MNFDKGFIGDVERFRLAAREHIVVCELLALINRSLLIDGNGNKEISAEGRDLALLEACQVASNFASYDEDSALCGQAPRPKTR